MATAWMVAAATAVVGWLVSPIITYFLPKIISCLGFDASEKLQELEFHIMQELEETLTAIDQERMMQRRKRKKSDVAVLYKMATMLRHAREDAEDIFDDAEHKIVIRCWHRLCGAAAPCTGFCNRICVWVARIFRSAIGSLKWFKEPGEDQAASNNQVQVNDNAVGSSHHHVLDIETSTEEAVSDATPSPFVYYPGTQLVRSLSAPTNLSRKLGDYLGLSEAAPLHSSLHRRAFSEGAFAADEAVLQVAPSDCSVMKDAWGYPTGTQLNRSLSAPQHFMGHIVSEAAPLHSGLHRRAFSEGASLFDEAVLQVAPLDYSAIKDEEAVSQGPPSPWGYPTGTQLNRSLSAPQHFMGHVVSESAPSDSGLHRRAFSEGASLFDEAILQVAPSDYSIVRDEEAVSQATPSTLGYHRSPSTRIRRSTSELAFCTARAIAEDASQKARTHKEAVSQATSSHSASVLATVPSRLCSFFDFIKNCLVDIYEKARVQRDLSYEGTGITINRENGTAIDCVLTALSGLNLKRRIGKIESIVSAVKKSPLLVQASKNALEDIANKNRSKIRVASDSRVFGREVLRDKIMKKLRETTQGSRIRPCYSVISIYGVAGSGKTTFARYTRDFVQEECKKDKLFDTIMCIHLSESFSVTDVFHEMLKDITKDPHSNIANREVLEDKLKESLSGKRFFLILDDLWSPTKSDNQLQELLSPLNAGHTGSKILVTARTKDAARALGDDDPIEMPDLDEDQYISMFMHYALGRAIVAAEFTSVGSEIAKKLHRSPIAAAIVAGRLGTNPDIRFWKNTAKLDMMSDTMDPLWWSYQQLNPDIRRCLEYCRIFPRRRKLRRDELVHLWGAQCFVKTSETEDMEDVAESYVQELVSCSFLQAEKTSDDIDCFTVHDLLHDLVDMIAGRDCIRIENAMCSIGEGWKEVPRDVRHVFIQEYDPQLITKKILELENLRTLIIDVVQDGRKVEQKVIDGICKKLPKLRVLAICLSKRYRSFKGEPNLSVPDSVGQKKHLRYFAFRADSHFPITLPSSINKLQHIQILDFGRSYISEFTFVELVNLRHIFCTTPVKLPYVGRLCSLRTIPDFIVSNEQGCELKQLRDLNKLRGCLEIRGLENVKSKGESLEANLAVKEQLTDLLLRWDFGGANTRCSPEVQVEVLEGMCPPVGLQELRISGYEGSRYPYWMVSTHSGGPKNLQKLTFSECSKRGPTPEFVEAFPHLRVLRLWHCSWDTLPGNLDHLTSLEELDLHSCKNIRSLPTLPKSLEKFQVYSCNDELKEFCQTIGDPNWQKIKKYIF